MTKINELLIANGQLVAETLRHLANNEIDSDYFAVTSECESYGTEVDCEFAITDYARQAAVTVDQLVAALEAAERERDELRAEQAEHDEQIARMEGKFSLAKRALDSKTARCEKAEAELRLRDAATGEPLPTQLVYSSALPKFIGDTDEIESYSCFISGKTPPRKTMTEAYADAKQVCGELYTAAQPAVLPPKYADEMTVRAELIEAYSKTQCEIAQELGCDSDNESILKAICEIKALGAQQQKVVELDNVFSINVAGVPVRVILLKDVSISLDAAGCKWEVKK